MHLKKPIPVLIDCDPGTDDAAALLLAFASPSLDIRGITTVSGNVDLVYTTRNALGILELIGMDCPVHQGAKQPLCSPPIHATEIHGIDGLHGVLLPSTTRTISKLTAWDAIYQEARATQGDLEIIALGPLTNLAIAFAKYDDLPTLISRIVIMGGSATIGNVTPAAEFNIFADAEAADIVLRSKVPIHFCGLNTTYQAFLTEKELEEISTFGSPQAQFFVDVTKFALQRSKVRALPGVPMHDPCAVLYTTHGAIFTFQPVWVGIELHGKITRGKTVTDLYSDTKNTPNATFVTMVDRTAFIKQVQTLMKSYSSIHSCKN